MNKTRIAITVLLLVFSCGLLTVQAAGEEQLKPPYGYSDENGDGINDLFRDANGDGIDDVSKKPYPHVYPSVSVLQA